MSLSIIISFITQANINVWRVQNLIFMKLTQHRFKAFWFWLPPHLEERRVTKRRRTSFCAINDKFGFRIKNSSKISSFVHVARKYLLGAVLSEHCYIPYDFIFVLQLNHRAINHSITNQKIARFLLDKNSWKLPLGESVFSGLVNSMLYESSLEYPFSVVPSPGFVLLK